MAAVVSVAHVAGSVPQLEMNSAQREIPLRFIYHGCFSYNQDYLSCRKRLQTELFATADGFTRCSLTAKKMLVVSF